MMRATVLVAMLCGLSVNLMAQTAQPSAEVSAHLDELFSVLQREWLHRNAFDWTGFRNQVVQRARAARSIPESYDAIRLALALLRDKHSYYIPASREPIFNPESPTQSTGECTPAAFGPPHIPADIGYVRIQITPQTPRDALQDAVRRADMSGTVGWIVDLRNSRGGNMWPALAGIGPLLGNGTAGFFVNASKRATPWGYLDGEAWLDLGEAAGPRTIDLAKAPHRLSVANARVAVLTDIGVASSGETIRDCVPRAPEHQKLWHAYVRSVDRRGAVSAFNRWQAGGRYERHCGSNDENLRRGG